MPALISYIVAREMSARPKGYGGYLSYEAPNPDLWARSPYDVCREGVELTKKLLQEAGGHRGCASGCGGHRATSARVRTRSKMLFHPFVSSVR